MSETSIRTDEDFEAFYERHWKYVYRLCYTYMKNKEDAEDCTEDVFVKVLTGDFVFTDEIHERKWLTITAINGCKDRLKSYARKNVGSIDDDMMPEIASPETEDLSDVTEAVLRLPEKYKDVIWLYYYEGYQTDEIAVMLGRPPSTVRNQLKDARGMLKKVLGGMPE
ncbi:MAG: RNA polymerase sigma factor [Lachnospiraceae bacterium]|nr:RNA polymerase sigma factor [Lachnospiraceae bacterium]